MSLFRGAPSQARADSGFFSSSNQFIPTRPPFATAGMPVTTTTAMQKVALMAAINLVANMPDQLELKVYNAVGGTYAERTKPGYLDDPEGEGYGFGDFGYKWLTSQMLRGNAFVKVNQLDSKTNRPSLVAVWDPDTVAMVRDPATGLWVMKTQNGQPVNRYPMSVDGVIHSRAFPQAGMPLGASIVTNFARTLGVALASEQFGADFFADGAHPTGLLTSDRAVDEKTSAIIKKRFLGAVRGSREPVVLGAGIKYTPLQVAPNESQFLETMKFTAAECCRMVGPGVAEILGYDTGTSMTYQNVQSRGLHLLIYAIDPWLVRLEKMISRLFLPGQQIARFDRNQILRMTAGDRWSVHTEELKTGAFTINEVRAEEGKPPVPWGDEPYLPALGPAAAAAAMNDKINPDTGTGGTGKPTEATK